MPADWDVAAGVLREPRLTLHMPIGPYGHGGLDGDGEPIPLECPHTGPYPAYSTLCCSECHKTGSQTERRILRAASERERKQRLAAMIDATLKADKEAQAEPKPKPKTRQKPRGKPAGLHRSTGQVVYHAMPPWRADEAS